MFSRFSAKLKSRKTARQSLQNHEGQPPPLSTANGDGLITDTNIDASTARDEETNTPIKENLWEVAGDRLNETDRKALGLEKASPVATAIQDVISITEKKYREYKEGGLQIRKRDGGYINVRDSAKNIIHYALQAQDVIKELVSFDPTGHASTAWSVVSIGLTLVQNDIERRDDIFAAAEYLARILSYYAIVDSHYRKRKVASDRGLENSLIEIYTAVLQYVAEVARAEKENAAARVLKSIMALSQQPLKDLKDAIEKKEQDLQKWTNIQTALEHRKTAESMLDGIDEAIERLKAIQSQNRSLQDREILDWLSTTSFSDSQNNTHRRKSPNTGTWFLQLPEYEEWKAAPGKLFWLYGAVGCGKSVLCSTIIQDIEEFCSSDPSRKYAYWYFQFSNDGTQKIYNMISSILRQFMPPTLPTPLIKLWEEHCNKGSKPHQVKLEGILDTVLETFQGEFFLIIDALDECPTKEDERSLTLQFLEGLLEKHGVKLHILATSRPEPDIRSKLEKYSSVDLETGLAGDVEKFVHTQLSNGRLSKWGESVKKRAIEKLLDIPERRFRWADLQIKRLEESKTETAFNKALDSIPVTLEATYHDALERLSPEDRDTARTILIWLSFSAVPLDLKTIAAVVSFPFPEDVVTTCTTSLVTVNISDNTVRLAHFSVKEFLVYNNMSGQWYQFSPISGHEAIATKAIDCLLETTEVLTRAAAVDQGLLIYAGKYWDHHLTELRRLQAHFDALQEKVCSLFTEHDIYFNWMRLASFRLDERWQPSQEGYEKVWYETMWLRSFEELEPPLCSASRIGLVPVIETLLARDTSSLRSCDTDDFHHDPFSSAAAYGNLEILELLLSKVDEIPRKSTELTLLHIQTTEADEKQLTKILNVLWDKGALHDQSRSTHRIIDESLVAQAASNNTGSGHILMRQLLDQRDKMGIKMSEASLVAAAINYDDGTELTRLFCDEIDAGLELTPSLVRRLREWVLQPAKLGAIEGLLKSQVSNITLDEEWVKCFAEGGKQTMETLLQEHGDEVQITKAVLISAAQSSRDPSTIRLLLSRRQCGTDIDKEILLAATRNSLCGCEIMGILLDDCVQDTIIDDEIIQSIAYSMSGLTMMKMLLRRQRTGLVVTEKSLCNACERNDREMLELLVNNAGDSDIPITERTLHAAASNPVHGAALLEYLFELQGHSLPVSGDVLISILRHQSHLQADHLLAFFLERWPEIQVTDQLLEAACECPGGLGRLLDRRDSDLPIEKMIKEIATGRYFHGLALEMLLDRQLVKLDDWLVEMVAGSYETLNVIYKRDPDFPVTPKVIIKAAEDADAMRILLNRQNTPLLVTEEVVKTAMMGFYTYEVITLLLTRLGSDAVPITEDILILAIQDFKFQVLELLLEHGRDLNLNIVWEAIWQDAGDDGVRTGLAVQAAGYLFRYIKFDIPVQLLARLPSKDPDAWPLRCPFDTFIRLCMQHRVPLPTTDEAVELIVERSSLDTIEILLEDHPEIPITQDHIETAKKNLRRHMNTNALVSKFLSAKMS